MDPNTRALIMGAAVSGGPATYVENVFSTWLYNGTGSTQTITNGIDLAGEGGLVWLKNRNIGYGENHALYDSERGIGSNLVYKDLSTDSTASQQDRLTVGLSSFNNDGFTVIGNNAQFNTSPNTYASWTFRKAPGFFDVVTYTGNGTAGRTIAHNLGSVPGCIIVKRTDGGGQWYVYHRSLGATKNLYLNNTDAQWTISNVWNDTEPTSSVFSVGDRSDVNGTGTTYVAYLFAHDEQIFGEGGDQSVIKCGSYTGTSSAGNFVNLGWEPQWVLIKNSTSAANWIVLDNMRGIATGSDDVYLLPNASSAESTFGVMSVEATGFTLTQGSTLFNATGNTYIYIAIRRGPMKTPTDATTVFATDTSDATSPSPPQFNAGFPPDAVFRKDVDTTSGTLISSRLQNTRFMYATSTAAEDTASLLTWDNMYGWSKSSGVDTSLRAWMFRRAPGFFDVVAYTGTGSATTVSHNLGVAPELMIVKSRSNSDDWIVYHSSVAIQNILKLQSTAAATDFGSPGAWNNTAPTASVFTVSGTGWSVNNSGQTYIAYLFATCPGVSKVGSYTGTGTTKQIDCGFTSGARLVLIKRTDSTGDWYVWDTARGIVSGNDPYYRLNVEAAQVTTTDYIDPLNSGFEISSSAPAAINANGGSFIFLAIA